MLTNIVEESPMMRSVLLAVLLGLSVGCQQATTPSSAPVQSNDKTNVHIRTPKVNVDVEGKGSGRGANVDVERKNP